ncbi:TPA: hypothetical protein ACGW1T_002648 [Raoultella ornithinolytica]
MKNLYYPLPLRRHFQWCPQPYSQMIKQMPHPKPSPPPTPWLALIFMGISVQAWGPVTAVVR